MALFVINDISASKFSINGREMFKTFTPVYLNESTISVTNIYDSTQFLFRNINVSDVEVDSVVYANATDLVTALVPVIFVPQGEGSFSQAQIDQNTADILALQTEKADINHNHNTLYYLKTEIDSIIAGLPTGESIASGQVVFSDLIFYNATNVELFRVDCKRFLEQGTTLTFSNGLLSLKNDYNVELANVNLNIQTLAYDDFLYASGVALDFSNLLYTNDFILVKNINNETLFLSKLNLAKSRLFFDFAIFKTDLDNATSTYLDWFVYEIDLSSLSVVFVESVLYRFDFRLQTAESISNKQNNLNEDGYGIKYPTVDAVNDGLSLKQNLLTNPIIGTGTINYLPKFTGVSALGNSRIFDNGTGVGIGTATPENFFHIQNGNNTEITLSKVSPLGLNNFRLGIKTITDTVIGGTVYEMGMFYSTSNIAILKFIRGGSANGTLDLELNNVTKIRAESAATGNNVYINGTSGNLAVGGNTTPTEKLHLQGNLRLTGSFKDANNDAGTSGQLLSSTGTGTGWINPSTFAWLRTGNAGTNPLTDFLGTTDNQALVFRTNNVEGARLLNGLVTVGNATNAGRISIVRQASGEVMVNDNYGDSSGNSAVTFLGRRARGTIASPSQALNNDVIFSLTGRTRHETGWSTHDSAAIRMIASENAQSTGGGARIVFFTTQNGTTVSSERVIITDDGNLGIGTNAPTQLLHVQGTARITGAFRDSSNSAGTSGQILSSTVTGTAWVVANRLLGYTVATLPTPSIGMTAYVTDALAPTYLTTVVGGGTVTCPVFYNGTNWVCH